MSRTKVKNFLTDNVVTIIFVILSLAGILVSGQPLLVIVRDITQRFVRNSFIVLSLIIPVVAGLGLNFGIVIGAMAAQMSVIFVMDLGIGGFPGILLAMAIAAPLSWLFGILIGKLLNKTRGQEMIASMIVGFFANGIYQLVYLAFMGRFIPVRTKSLILSSGVGVRNTVDLGGADGRGGLKYAIDDLWKLNFFVATMIIAGLFLIYQIYRLLKPRKIESQSRKKRIIIIIALSLAFIFGFLGQFKLFLPREILVLRTVPVPMVTMLLIAALAIFTTWILKTKLGQDFRSVGQSQPIAGVSGIDVDKTRITAVIISTILAAWGHIILLQNIGVLNTYGSHVSIGLYGVAALLVGGATVDRATIGQAFLGVLLFHTLFFISPFAGKVLLNDAQNAEYFRNIVAYGVIGLSLMLYAWKRSQALKR
ncbi:MAG: ABC transporter permease [Eubacteriales bacterium]|nr:ABC transporter permease [Eubacteriales bacterium]